MKVVLGTGRDTGTLKTTCGGLEQQPVSVPACLYLVSYFSARARNPDSNLLVGKQINHPMGRWGPWAPSHMVACTHLLSHYLPPIPTLPSMLQIQPNTKQHVL